MTSEKILILEDEPTVAALYAAGLEAAGHQVVVCTTYAGARDALRREVPRGLLTDVRVAEYNGLQLAILFRTLSPNGALLVVSGHDDPVIREDVARLGAAFLTKPLKLARLTNFFAR